MEKNSVAKKIGTFTGTIIGGLISIFVCAVIAMFMIKILTILHGWLF